MKNLKKSILIILFALLAAVGAKAQEPFVTTWAPRGGVIVIPDREIPNYSYDYNVKIYDVSGMILLESADNVSGQYTSTSTAVSSAEKVRVEIMPNINGGLEGFPTICFAESNDANRGKILSVDNWGSVRWKDLSHAFFRCSNLATVPAESPNLSCVEDMRYMFCGATVFNQDLSDWDVSSVKNMSYMFRETTDFDSPLNWGDKTGNVTNMFCMFYYATAFNQDLSSWDVSSVTKMEDMFHGAAAFNSPLDWKDKTANVKDMGYMFCGATKFNQDLSDWDVSSVEDMSQMFRSADAFNNKGEPLDWGNKTKNVTTMYAMFYKASKFDQNISGWDISSLTTADFMLDNCDMSPDNYDALLMGWNDQVKSGMAPENIRFRAFGLCYCIGGEARKALMEKGWGDGTPGDQSGNYTDIVDAGSLAEGYELTVSDNRIEVCASLGIINLNELVNYSVQNWRLRDGISVTNSTAFVVTGYPNGHLLTLDYDAQFEFCTDTFSDQGTLYLKISDEIEAHDATAEVCLEEAEAINLSLLLGVLAEGSWSGNDTHRTDNIFNGYDAYDENGEANQSFQFKFTPTSTSCLNGEAILTVVITKEL
ncbi:MAG: BspA family leucine-rich repeat surface protein [Mangrovibacterium sp.]